jgi:phosphoribosyl 1,2-cyclic phosphate phosphodiesterase
MIRDVRFIQMGTGTSAGVPIIGCDCAICRSDDPRDARLRCGACIRFTDGDGEARCMLIDTSPDLRQQALTHHLSRCDGILYTHNHVDHTFGLDEVRRFNVVMQQPIDVFAEAHTLAHLHRVYQHIFQRHANVNDSFVATLIPHEIDLDTPVDRYGLRFTPLRFLHGNLPVLGFRLEALDAVGSIAVEQPGPLPLAYCTDVSAVPPETWPRLSGLRTLLLDMLRYRSHPTHMTVDQSITVAEQIGAESTWFIHMTHDIAHAELDPKLPDGMQLAWDGLVLDGC